MTGIANHRIKQTEDKADNPENEQTQDQTEKKAGKQTVMESDVDSADEQPIKRNVRRYSRRYDLKGLQLAAVAFVIMALGGFAVYLFRMFNKMAVVEFAYIGLIFVAWVLMFASLRNIAEYSPHFSRAYYAALPGIMSALINGIVTAFDYSNGEGYHSFITLGAMFTMYICFMAMLYAYTHVLLGCSELCREFHKTKLQLSCAKIWKKCMVVMIISLIVIQGAPVFSEMKKYMLTGVAAMVMLICHMIMIRKILAVYEACDGKRSPGRLNDVLSFAEAEPEGIWGEMRAKTERHKRKDAADDDESEPKIEEPAEEREMPAEEYAGESELTIEEDINDEDYYEEATEESDGADLSMDLEKESDLTKTIIFDRSELPSDEQIINEDISEQQEPEFDISENEIVNDANDAVIEEPAEEKETENEIVNDENETVIEDPADETEEIDAEEPDEEESTEESESETNEAIGENEPEIEISENEETDDEEQNKLKADAEGADADELGEEEPAEETETENEIADDENDAVIEDPADETEKTETAEPGRDGSESDEPEAKDMEPEGEEPEEEMMDFEKPVREEPPAPNTQLAKNQPARKKRWMSNEQAAKDFWSRLAEEQNQNKD